MSAQICQIHLGPRGPERVTVDSMLVKFRDEITKSAINQAGLTLDDAALQRYSSQLKDLRKARFFSARDSLTQDDTRHDNRARKWLSITRDMMTQHQFPKHPNAVQELHFIKDSSVPFFGRRTSDAGVDHERFLLEFQKLQLRRLVDEAPDFSSDESMCEFMDKIHDMAMEEAQRCNIDRGQPNRVIDAAPGLYLFSELLKRTEKLIEEDFTELWARRIFPILNLNTWMPQWYFERIDDRTTLPNYIDIERLPSNAQRGSENRDAELRNLAFYMHAASWSKLELMRFAEATANGAPNLKLDQRRVNNAIRMMNFKEDLLTFFGDTEVNILGLFSAEAKTDIERIPSTDVAGPFGTSDPEGDRNLLIEAVERIGKSTEQALLPDTLMVSTATWYYINKTLYGSVDSDAGTNKTVLDMAMQTLEKFGIKDILWVPEVGYSEQQKERLKDHGLDDAEAQQYAGGIGDGKQAMVACKRDAEVMEMVVAKDRTMYPAAETRTDRVETRMMQGSGGLAVYKPAGVKILTDVGPNPAP